MRFSNFRAASKRDSTPAASFSSKKTIESKYGPKREQRRFGLLTDFAPFASRWF
jgi:hypothetical protein